MAHRIHVNEVVSVLLLPLRSIVLLAATMLLASCGVFTERFYSAEAISARVVDHDTKKPIEGVVIMAHWILMRGTFGGRVPVGTMHILETVTDANGNFSFPAWGPLANTTEGHLDHEDPIVWFFKPGYNIGGISNHYAVSYIEKFGRRKWERNGTTIELGVFPGTTAEYAEHIRSRSRLLLENPNPNLAYLALDCHFMKTPLLAEAIDGEIRSLEARGHKRGGFNLAQTLKIDGAKCGHVRSYGAK